jgi:uncharacterized protein (TIGR00297 family)
MSYLAEIQPLPQAAAAHKIWIFALISAIFAVFGRLVRGVTTGGAIAGTVVCFVLLWAAGISGFAALLTVFALTWVSTRIGYSRKQRLGTAERRSGRDALQVTANLGTAAACAVLYVLFPHSWVFAGTAAALAEAAADTVSSEVGQATGGVPRLITTWREVERGTNGAVTGIGTATGILAAVAIAYVFLVFREIGLVAFVVIAFSSVLGMIFDSFLGATVEGRGPVGNNLVNFLSTLAAAVVASLLIS